MLRPPRLRRGDTVAAISLSSGLAALFPHRYEAGKRQLEETFGVRVVETPNALRDDEWLYRHPEARADDLHWALTEPGVAGIVSTIGGDESVRILPHLDLDLVRANPKVFLGFSDSTVTLTAFLLAGVTSFHGPALMTDLAENAGMHPLVERGVRRALFEAEPFALEPAPEWTEEFLDWADPTLQERRRAFAPSGGWAWLQGAAPAEGRLIGGCVEVLENLKGTAWWPPASLWDGAVLFLETSEEVPAPEQVGRWLRNYGMQGILARLSGLLLARARGYDAGMTDRLYAEVRRVLAEFDRSDLPVVANLDIGHTSPQLTLPVGCRARIDPSARTVVVLEAGVS